MTTDTQTSRAVAESFLQRLGAQDPEGIQDLFAPEIDWYVPGSDELPWTGRRTRRDEVAPYFTTMWPAFVTGKSEVAVERIVVEDGDVLVLATLSHVFSASGKRFTTPSIMHLAVEDGSITKLHLYEDTLTVFQASKAD